MNIHNCVLFDVCQFTNINIWSLVGEVLAKPDKSLALLFPGKTLEISHPSADRGNFPYDEMMSVKNTPNCEESCIFPFASSISEYLM